MHVLVAFWYGYCTGVLVLAVVIITIRWASK